MSNIDGYGCVPPIVQQASSHAADKRVWFCVGAGSSDCVTMDMATSAYAWFALLEAKAAGRPIPGNVALDADGQPTTDPDEVRVILHILLVSWL